VLTSRLAPRVAHLTAIEIDRNLAASLRPQLPPNVDLVCADVLTLDFAPYLTRGPLRVAGNLPYNISTPILFKLLRISGTPGADATMDASSPRLPLVDATVMLQLEVAERLLARPGIKDYGVLTIFASAQADITHLLTLPPGAFRPAPKVRSAVVRLVFKPSVIPIGHAGVFERMVRTMFMQRRKTLSNALGPFSQGTGWTSGVALSIAGIDGKRRPETLDLGELVRLSSVFAQAPPDERRA
jgi:16S rRNA (adenine1518-N6/adenine1519-N6)-dimethyltransferase